MEGRVARQAHAGLPDGTYEREIGRDGFFGPATHMYHRHPPTSWTSWEGPLRPRAFDLARLNAAQPSPFDASEVLFNSHVRLRHWRAPTRMDHLARNGDGDELMFVHEGSGDLFCDYGHLAFEAGDYIVLPRSTMWRIETDDPVTALLIEATNNAYALPDRGMIGHHAIFDPGVLDRPAIDEAFLDQQGDGEVAVRVKRRGALSTVTYPHNPLDAVGWSGSGRRSKCRIMPPSRRRASG
jgi:homogentisate 1,2-dioxygenase